MQLDDPNSASLTIWTIGHSNHAQDRLLDLLTAHEIGVLVDVRSRPFSAYAPHFNDSQLKDAVVRAGLRYVFLGRELGGRPDGDDYYDADDHVLYDRVARSTIFQDGVERLITDAGHARVAIMCSEENPTDCHRRLLVGRVLANQGIGVRHIRGDGRVQSESEVERETAPATQLGLWDDEQEKPWRSTRPVSRRKQPPSSSAAYSEPE